LKGANLRTQAVIETAIYVDDLQPAETFYGAVLGLRVMGKEPGRHVFVQVGEIVLLSEDEARVQMVPTLQTTPGVTHQHLPYFSPPFKQWFLEKPEGMSRVLGRDPEGGRDGQEHLLG
jgi:catechol 2,3-dioxygenase-like lactoylglutathione lyase family enzyme